jgi:hypothetical protein
MWACLSTPTSSQSCCNDNQCDHCVIPNMQEKEKETHRKKWKRTKKTKGLLAPPKLATTMINVIVVFFLSYSKREGNTHIGRER